MDSQGKGEGEMAYEYVAVQQVGPWAISALSRSGRASQSLVLGVELDRMSVGLASGLKSLG